MSIGKPLHCRDDAPMKCKKSNAFHKAIDESIRKHNNDGCQVTKIRCDNAFQELMDAVRDNVNVEMECVAPEEHKAAAE